MESIATRTTVTYFDNAATSFPKAPGVGDAMATFLERDAANPGRAGHRMAVAAEQMLDDTRLKLVRLFDAEDHRRMIFTFNCTDALNMAIKGVIQPGGWGGQHVISTVLEHNSVSRPLQALADGGVIELTRVDCDGDGFVDPDDIRRAIRLDTRLIVMTHASNVLGTIQDIAAVGAIARQHDVLFCVDAAQTAGAVPISVEQMAIDLLAFPGHKSLLGPTGTGGLYVGPRCPEPIQVAAVSTGTEAVTTRSLRLRPWREGGTGGDSSTATQPALYPYYLEGGTPNTVGIAGLAVAVDYVVAQELETLLQHERTLIGMIIEKFADDRRVTLYGRGEPAGCVGTISLNIEGYEPSDVGSILDDSFNIAVRPGLHCAPYTHKRLGTFASGTVRISPGPFNTRDELQSLIDAMDQMMG